MIPAAFLTQTVCLDDTTVKFEIWDTAGQERYHSLAPMYYRGAQAAIVVYDITNQVRIKCYVHVLFQTLNNNGSVSLYVAHITVFVLIMAPPLFLASKISDEK